MPVQCRTRRTYQSGWGFADQVISAAGHWRFATHISWLGIWAAMRSMKVGVGKFLVVLMLVELIFYWNSCSWIHLWGWRFRRVWENCASGDFTRQTLGRIRIVLWRKCAGRFQTCRSLIEVAFGVTNSHSTNCFRATYILRGFLGKDVKLITWRASCITMPLVLVWRSYRNSISCWMPTRRETSMLLIWV